MSKIFYDKLLGLGVIAKRINSIYKSQDEREEVWQIIDEVVHHRVLGCIFDNLNKKHHDSFLKSFHEAPYDENHFKSLSSLIGKDVKRIIKKEVANLKKELLEEIGSEK